MYLCQIVITPGPGDRSGHNSKKFHKSKIGPYENIFFKGFLQILRFYTPFSMLCNPQQIFFQGGLKVNQCALRCAHCCRQLAIPITMSTNITNLVGRPWFLNLLSNQSLAASLKPKPWFNRRFKNRFILKIICTTRISK